MHTRRSVLKLVVALILLTSAGPLRAQDDKKLPKVFIIGDSISLGYTEPVRKLLQDKAIVSRPKTNCQHTAYGLANIKAWLGDEKYDVIHFNWGIWDTHMISAQGALIRDESKVTDQMHIRHTPEKYRENLAKLVETMQKSGTKLIWANTTPVMSRTGKRFDDIKNLNKVAEEVMREKGVIVNDLYEFVLPNAKEWQGGDKVHFNAVGNENLAKRVAASIEEALGKKKDK